MTYIVAMKKRAFCDLKSAIPPEARFSSDLPFNHFYLYSPDGSAVVFTDDESKRKYLNGDLFR
jgi:hypothetical protein